MTTDRAGPADLLAPSGSAPPSAAAHRPARVLVFDSGLGGLTVHAEIAALRPDVDYVYLADDAGFPYGAWAEPDLVARVRGVVGEAIARHAPDVVVIACNTASTLVLPDLRATFPTTPFVGTVPAIKPAAASSQTKMISVLATPGTVARDYTRDLVEKFAAGCRVTLVGSRGLASLAEAAMAGESVPDVAIASEIGPCFVEDGARRTDRVVLACTHYPLLRDRMAAVAPWPVTFIDPAPAIARRVGDVLAGLGFGSEGPAIARGRALVTSGVAPSHSASRVFARYALDADEGGGTGTDTDATRSQTRRRAG